MVTRQRHPCRPKSFKNLCVWIGMSGVIQASLFLFSIIPSKWALEQEILPIIRKKLSVWRTDIAYMISQTSHKYPQTIPNQRLRLMCHLSVKKTNHWLNNWPIVRSFYSTIKALNSILRENSSCYIFTFSCVFNHWCHFLVSGGAISSTYAEAEKLSRSLTQSSH